ncbi:MAG: HIT family protein [Patescibacteria group bacterium]|jgi:diadenosine tetraphosphate (Ap4A) HIT family hydrolase|nr:HIT family protein [Patescibacteria group bacterium]
MEQCIFCKIANKDISSVSIWEDDDYYAFLDLNPNTRGMTLVIPKDHFDSDLFDLSDKEIALFLQATKKVSKILERGLKVQRVALVIEGMGVDHLHAKLYPLHGLSEKFSENWASDKIYFDNYEGYLSTQLGPTLSVEELNKVALEIKNNQ